MRAVAALANVGGSGGAPLALACRRRRPGLFGGVLGQGRNRYQISLATVCKFLLAMSLRFACIHRRNGSEEGHFEQIQKPHPSRFPTGEAGVYL